MNGIDVFSIMLAEDDILREALQEIWEMSQADTERAEHCAALYQIYDIVDEAVRKLDALADRRRDG